MRTIAILSVTILLQGIISPLAQQVEAEEPAAMKETELLKTFMAELVEITPGKGKFPATFKMGSETGDPNEQPIHEVTFTHSFWIAKYEVPQNLYQAIMGKNPSRWKGPRNSVEMMTHAEAVKFCQNLTAALHKAKLLPEAEQIRLPSEAEWEYCCRAGTKTAYSFGDDAQAKGDKEKIATLLDPYAWHTGNAAGNDPEVGVLKPNPWGLYDMHGYLWEFCSDTWHDSYTGAPTDGLARTGDQPIEKFVIRGGSWKDSYPSLRSAARMGIPATATSDAVGIRCVRGKVK